MGNQNFNAWYTVYPSTHVRAGQTVQVITREAYDGKVAQLEREIARLHKIVDPLQWANPEN